MADGLKRARKAAAETRLPMRDKIILNGVRNLQQFGYRDVTTANILTDDIYKAFFISMVRDNYGKGVDEVLDGLMKELGEAAPQS